MECSICFRVGRLAGHLLLVLLGASIGLVQAGAAAPTPQARASVAATMAVWDSVDNQVLPELMKSRTLTSGTTSSVYQKFRKKRSQLDQAHAGLTATAKKATAADAARLGSLREQSDRAWQALDEWLGYLAAVLPVLEDVSRSYHSLDDAPNGLPARIDALRTAAREIREHANRFGRMAAPRRFSRFKSESVRLMREDAGLYDRFAQAIESQDRARIEKVTQEFMAERRADKEEFETMRTTELSPAYAVRQVQEARRLADEF